METTDRYTEMKEVASALLGTLVLTDFRRLWELINNTRRESGSEMEVFGYLYVALNGFHRTECINGDIYFDYNFGCFASTIYYRKEKDAIELCERYEVWVGDYSSPIASVELKRDNTEMFGYKYRELWVG